MKFGFIAKHRGIWPIKWLCEALGVSRSGFHAWLMRSPSRRAREDQALSSKVCASFLNSDRTYGARRVWHDLLADSASCGLHRVERLMRAQALRARPRRRGLPADNGERKADAIAPNLLDRQFEVEALNKKWGADFTYIWTAEGWLYVSAVIDRFSRRVVGWSMKAEMKSFFSSLKTERVRQKIYRTRNQARADVFDDFERFYNPKRRHSTIGYLSPAEFERRAQLA